MGLVGWGKGSRTGGHSAAAGMGFDFVGEISLMGKHFAYAEKSGDTNMHKARLGLLPELGAGVLLLSNLGGSVGGPLTAMKFGALVKLAGGTDADANAATDAALNASGFWESQWGPLTTCTQCAAAASSRQCSPSGLSTPPMPPASFAGEYGTPAYGLHAVSLAASGDVLRLAMGAANNMV